MGVGLLAGSTIYFLTLLWGTCVIVGKRELPESSNSKDSEPSTPNPSPHKKRFSILTGYGITTDQETNYTAMIMVSSLIPFILLQVPADVFKFSYGEGLVVLSALIVSFLLLLVYIIYQIFEPWIQSRRLEYIKHEHLILGILNHVQRHALGNLLTEDGEPNIRVIKRLFEDLDQDGSDCLSQSELEDLILKIKFGNKNLDRDDAVFQVMKELDLDGDHKITKEEFIAGFVKWLDEAKHTISCEGFCLNKSYDHLYQAVQPWVERRRQKLEKIEHMMAGLLKYAQGHDQENLITDEGKPNTPCLRRLFMKFDLDGDKRISHAELKKLIVDTKFENMNVENDNAVEKVMKELDADGDELITEEEFLNAFTKWIKEVIQATDKRGPHSKKSLDDFLKTWEAADVLVDEKRPSKGVSKQSLLVWLQAVSLLVLGIALLSMLSAPLVVSVQNFSDAINIPSFFISFIIIPLATNSGDAVSMIIAASRKRSRTINLTFSEIYGAVFMNNILSLLALLSLVYARGLTWNFSTEVLVVVLVCAIIGLMASFRSTFPLWTSCIAYLLYPLSLVLIYVLIYGLGWS